MSTTELYRHFDVDGRLLYVGISISTMLRLRSHKNSAKWFDQIVTITVERYPTREECHAAEIKAIRSEKPLFNTRDALGEYVGVKKVSDVLGVDPKTLRKWVRDGVCPVRPQDGIEPPVWRRADVEAFVGLPIA